MERSCFLCDIIENMITGTQAKAADRYAIDVMGIPSLTLMENASREVASYIEEHFASEKILILCGTGNNGADGICIANILNRNKKISTAPAVVVTGNLEHASWEFLHQLSDSYFSWTDDAVKKREKEKGVQTKDEIISRFRQQLGEMRSDRSFVKSLEDAVNASNDNLINHLRTEYKDKLKELDFNILTMMYSGLSIKSIAFYFRMTEPSIRTRKTRYKHLFEESGSPLSGKYIGLMD